MTDLPTLRDLLSRVEQAEGPNLALEVDIARALGTAPTDFSFVEETQSWQRYIAARDDVQMWMPPAYTASLDSALALVNEMLPGCDKSLEWVSDLHGKETQAYLHCEWGDAHGGYVAKGTSGWDAPALAILSALLCALIAQAEQKSEATDA
jgi:hypothetical protein